jgi:HTH-type transcriptional regulator / antitoxin HigA
MTLTFNPAKYKDLLAWYQPKLIRTESENALALAVAEELMHRPNRSPEENELYELLIVLIEKFEQDYYSPGAASTPHSMLLFLMEQRNLKPCDLVDIFGAEEVVSAVINDKREISQTEAQVLGQFFHVDPGVFWVA